MTPRPRMTTIWCGVVATTPIALVAARVGLSRQAQTLLAPSFTAAQAATGRATYAENCASCHGANLDDGAFAPALRGPEFRSSWFGRAADQLFTKLETMPPAAPGSLGAGRTADDANGRELWRMRLNDVPNSAPISYQVNGKQYITVVTGNGGAQAATFPALVPEIQNPPDRGASLWVFELPDRLVRR